MAFTYEDAFWANSGRRAGRPRKFYTSEALEEACFSYFKWCDDNPLQEHKVSVVDKNLENHSVPHKRVYTLTGLYVHLGIGEKTWNDWRNQEDGPFLDAIETVQMIIKTQKFEGAAAGFFNANIIARDLGLGDKNTISGDPDNPLSANVSIFRIPDNER